MSLSSLQPVPQLLSRVKAELGAAFNPGKPMRVSRAPARLDVMGGIAADTGSLVCQATLDRAVAVVLQPRADRQLQIFSFNLFDDHLPFTFNILIDHLARADVDALWEEFEAPGRTWAGYIAGCLYMLHHDSLIDLSSPSIQGLNLALLSTVPAGAGIGSSAAIEGATMMNLLDHFSIRDKVDPLKVAQMCQAVENRILGVSGGIVDQLCSCVGEQDALFRLLCQPHEIQPTLLFPAGIRVVGIDSKVSPGDGGALRNQTRCAAFMGHTMIVNKMREMGQAAGLSLLSDPTQGYLANLDPDDYKRFFRAYLPESILGGKFLADFGPTIDIATSVNPANTYFVQQATDHHVLEANRIRKFVQCLSQANELPSNSTERNKALNKAGHLMYASHQAYSKDARLGSNECDLLVKLVRDREPEGFYGAKITDNGSGGTVAILCNIGDRTNAAIDQIMAEYEKQTTRKPEAFFGSSPGAWQFGTVEYKAE
jgi:galactokinase